MITLMLFALLSTAAYYLGSRALITRFLWSRYSPGFARFVDCAACTGFWWGVMCSLTLSDLFPPVFMNGITVWHGWAIVIEAFLVGLCMLVLTPIVAGIMQRGLEAVGSAVTEDAPDDKALD